jgi:hypothetical protein
MSLVCLGKVKSEARPNQLIAFARCLGETLPIKDRDLLARLRNQPDALKLPDGIGDGRPLDTQHFGEQALSNKESVTVIAIAHHEQPTC